MPEISLTCYPNDAEVIFTWEQAQKKYASEWAEEDKE